LIRHGGRVHTTRKIGDSVGGFLPSDVPQSFPKMSTFIRTDVVAQRHGLIKYDVKQHPGLSESAQTSINAATVARNEFALAQPGSYDMGRLIRALDLLLEAKRAAEDAFLLPQMA
jgi:hypothetical protein